jgi:DNA polymerase III alpha subunit (gram-positive type)
VASHTYFDFCAIRNANERYGVAQIPWEDWVDTCKIARAAWPHLPSYKLSHLAHTFGISYHAHNATCVFGKPALSRILGLFPGGFAATTSG